MANIDVDFPTKKQKEVLEPTQIIELYHIKGSKNFVTDKYKLTVPSGKYAKVKVRIFIQEIDQKEYERSLI